MKREFPLKTRDTGNSMVISKGKGWCGKEEEGLEGINGDGRRCDLG